MRGSAWIAVVAAAITMAACDSRPLVDTSGSGGGGGQVASTSSTSTTSAGGGGAGGSPAVPACSAGMPLVCNPYGVDMEAPALSGDAYWTAISNTLRSQYYQPAPIVLEHGATCVGCVEAVQHGLRLVLPIRVNQGPGTLPKDVSMVQAILGELLDAHQAAVAAVVIEAGTESQDAWAGSVDEYLALLAAGCAAAHAKGVRCTDGGLSSTTMIFLLADFEVAGGDAAAAIKLITLAGDNPEVKAAFATWPPATEQDLAAGLATQKARLDTAKQLLAGVRAAGVDYANWHWYERDQDTLDHAIAFMRNQTGCNALAITDMGQRTQDKFDAMKKLDDAKELGVSLVIWSARGDAAALVDGTGALTPNGDAFATLSTLANCLD